MLARRGAARRQIGATAGSPLRSRRCPTNGDKYQALDFARMMSLPRVSERPTANPATGVTNDCPSAYAQPTPDLLEHLPVEDLADHRDARTPARDRRAAVLIAGGLVLLAGVWLVLAPFVLRYRAGDPIWNDMACGRRS